MKLLKFNQYYIKESHTIDDNEIKDIFIDLTDKGFTLIVKKGFSSYDDEDEYWNFSEVANARIKKPSYDIELRTSEDSKESIDIEFVKSIVSDLEDCINKLSNYGKCILLALNFDSNYIKFLLVDNEAKEEEVNTTEGFEDFRRKLRNKFSGSYNKITRGFELILTKEGAILKPKDNSINSKQLLTQAKAFIKKSLDRKVHYGGRPNYSFQYDVNLVDDQIHVIFKKRVNDTPEYSD